MPSKYDQEKLVGILLRKITAVIVTGYQKTTLPRIYKGKDGNISEVSKHCMEWNDEINRFFSDTDPEEKKKKDLYIKLLIIYEYEDIDPDTDELWKLLMKLYIPELFYKKFEPMGQVPKIASLDITEPPDTSRKQKDIKNVGW